MIGSIPRRAAGLAVALLAATVVVAMTAGAASAAVLYNNIPRYLPGNFASIGLAATSTSEFGGQVGFGKPSGKKPTVIVTMSSWACESGGWSEDNCVTALGATFKWPITLNVYEVGAENSVGALLTTSTKEFEIPYRPPASPICKGELKDDW